MADSESRPQRQLEPQAESNVAIASVVHDVNQMLAVIVGRSGLLESQVDNAELLPHLRAIGLAAKDAGDIMNRLAGAIVRRLRPSNQYPMAGRN